MNILVKSLKDTWQFTLLCFAMIALPSAVIGVCIGIYKTLIWIGVCSDASVILAILITLFLFCLASNLKEKYFG